MRKTVSPTDAPYAKKGVVARTFNHRFEGAATFKEKSVGSFRIYRKGQLGGFFTLPEVAPAGSIPAPTERIKAPNLVAVSWLD